MARPRRDLVVPRRIVPHGDFSRALGAIAAAYFDYSECLAKEQKDSGKTYTECPVVCPERPKKYDLDRSEHCRNCPQRKHWKAFKVDTDELWTEWFGEDHGFDFDFMYGVMLMVEGLEAIPRERLSVKGSALLRVYTRERDKADRRRAG